MADALKRSLARNLISEAGMLIAIIALANIIFLIYIDITSAENPYLGILTYVIVPAILVAGLLLFAFGLFWERRHPLAHEHRQRDHLRRQRRAAPEHRLREDQGPRRALDGVLRQGLEAEAGADCRGGEAADGLHRLPQPPHARLHRARPCRRPRPRGRHDRPHP